METGGGGSPGQRKNPARRRWNGAVAGRETSRTEPRDGGRSVGGRGRRWGGGGPAGLGLSNPSRRGDGAAPSRPGDVKLRPEGEEIGRQRRGGGFAERVRSGKVREAAAGRFGSLPTSMKRVVPRT